jgi:hypothetical protein
VSKPWVDRTETSSPERAAETFAIGSVALSGLPFIARHSPGFRSLRSLTLGYDRSPHSGLKTKTDTNTGLQMSSQIDQSPQVRVLQIVRSLQSGSVNRTPPEDETEQ